MFAPASRLFRATVAAVSSIVLPLSSVRTARVASSSREISLDVGAVVLFDVVALHQDRVAVREDREQLAAARGHGEVLEATRASRVRAARERGDDAADVFGSPGHEAGAEIVEDVVDRPDIDVGWDADDRASPERAREADVREQLVLVVAAGAGVDDDGGSALEVVGELVGARWGAGQACGRQRLLPLLSKSERSVNSVTVVCVVAADIFPPAARLALPAGDPFPRASPC
ncbi:MAG: hypothetical protein SangKO_072300 [Sandaracinaceae bacterium]